MRWVTRWWLLALVACQGGRGGEHGAGEHGHPQEEAHGAAHGHGHGEGHGEEEAAAFAVTRWTQTHELFVEFDAPVAGGPVAYHAHVTRLVDHQAVTTGQLEVAWLQGSQAVERAEATAVARPGIFAFSAPAPRTPGAYTLRFSYRQGDEAAAWDPVEVALATEPSPPPAAPEGEIAFLKEAQWNIPFSTAVAEPRTLGRTLRLLGVVRPAAGRERAVVAPAAGRLEWVAPVVVGQRVQAGEVVARLVPAAATDHWSTVRLRVRESEVERRRLQAEVQRLSGLAREGLVPAHLLDAARSELAQVQARLEAARQQAPEVEAEARPVVAPVDGVVTAVAAEGPVPAGEVLVRLLGAGASQVEVEVLPAEVPDLAMVLDARLEDGPPLERRTEALLVDPHTGLARLTFAAPDLPPGAQVPVRLEVGPPTPRLAVPRAAVVEINTRPFVFVVVGGESFTRRAVVLAGGNAEYVGIEAGLTARERVVVRGAFDVYVASLGGQLESHRH